MTQSPEATKASAVDEPPRPEPPDPSDCCMSGCLRCVYDLYDLNLERWEEQVASIRARQMQPKD